MNFEYDVANSECVEKKKIWRAKSEKENKLFVVCCTLAHDKVCVCRVRGSSTWQTQVLPYA